MIKTHMSDHVFQLDLINSDQSTTIKNTNLTSNLPSNFPLLSLIKENIAPAPNIQTLMHDDTEVGFADSDDGQETSKEEDMVT